MLRFVSSLLLVLSILLETLIFIDFFQRISFFFSLMFSIVFLSSISFISALICVLSSYFLGFILLFFIWFLSRNLGYWYDTFHLFNVNIYCYKFTFQHCLSCIPYILVHFAFIFILFYGVCFFFNLFWDFLFDHGIIGSMSFSMCSKIFLPFTYSYFYPTMIENILCMISIYLNLRFIFWPRICSILVNVSWS